MIKFIFGIIWIVLLILFIKNIEKNAYNKGGIYGYSIAIDTIKNILKKQNKSDSTITKLTIEYDTVEYYISKKILLKK